MLFGDEMLAKHPVRASLLAVVVTDDAHLQQAGVAFGSIASKLAPTEEIFTNLAPPFLT
jgi:hypothetical protein